MHLFMYICYRISLNRFYSNNRSCTCRKNKKVQFYQKNSLYLKSLDTRLPRKLFFIEFYLIKDQIILFMLIMKVCLAEIIILIIVYYSIGFTELTLKFGGIIFFSRVFFAGGNKNIIQKKREKKSLITGKNYIFLRICVLNKKPLEHNKCFV